MDYSTLFDFEQDCSEEKKNQSTASIVRTLKESEEDFEWYPTTQEIVDTLVKKIIKPYDCRDGLEFVDFKSSILDIGCGNGGFFSKMKNSCLKFWGKTVGFCQYYGIEKSLELFQLLPDNVCLLGTDFLEQTLIDKKVGLIFCNPPYSAWDIWAEKIIKEGNCEAIALVIPQRWKNSDRIREILKKRKMQAEVLGSFDFMNAERKARANVDLVYITGQNISDRTYSYYGKCQIKDPFDFWFEETFSISAEKDKEYSSSNNFENKKREVLNLEGDLVENLLAMYNADMKSLQDNYRGLEKLDPALFKELNVNIDNIKEGLKKRLEGLKNLYWGILFDRYNRITKCLTKSYRDHILDRLHENVSIDFTRGNIYQMTLWLINNANTIFNEQLTDFFYSLCSIESMHRYKSNLRWNEDDWRYIKQNLNTEYGRRNNKYIKTLKNIQLDYRIVCESYSNSEGYYENRMSDDCYNFLNDIQIMAVNLGFELNPFLAEDRYQAHLCDYRNFTIMQRNGEEFANIKLYKNGNRHIKFCKSFMQRLNVEMGRINGWVRDKKEASKEFGLSEEEISDAWGKNKKFDINSGCKLLGCNSISIA